MYRRLSIIPFLLLFPVLVYGDGAPRTFAELAFDLIDLMNYAVGTLIVLALVLYFSGATKFMLKLKKGETDTGDMQKFFAIGVAILFVMVSIWGILRILENTIFSTGANGAVDYSSEDLYEQGFDQQ